MVHFEFCHKQHFVIARGLVYLLSPDAFANLLSYMYTDQVVNLNADNGFHTMNCADKYDVAPLVQICLEKIVSQLDVDSCLFVMEQAVEWHADNILEKCCHLLDAKTDDILRSEHFPGIRKDTLRTLLQRSTLSAGEQDIYLAVERWATEGCKRNNKEPSAANRRQMLGDTLFLVRFPLLTAAQLADGPATNGLLTDSELRSIFMYQNAAVKPAVPFPTEERCSLSMSMGFDRNAAVFARGSHGIWELAKVIERRQSGVAIRWDRDGRDDCVKPDRVVLASDIQITHQAITNAGGLLIYYPGLALRV
ncbi:BTB/POZ domain-containing protein 6-B-like isoform X2 [Paramacrobiotus metropolitanus]|uniref:BTB/POZ domain-containing protein 6-B-like isoform X2 n=1 Tax=Paramacrobiotus metropolitanus TaxID=2943436 RepID=UPI002445F437|nr:BTB/POZ domain-containing protein 6-B-like isoform X2 [Paramacrobiotus metropolitanus]